MDVAQGPSASAGDGSLPPFLAAAFQAYHLAQVQSGSVAVGLSSALYGVSVLLFLRYLSIFWSGRTEPAILPDRFRFKAYVLSLFTVATAYILIVVAGAWNDATLSIQRAGVYEPTPGALQVADFWVLNIFCGLTEAYWLWRATRISRHIAIRVLAVLLWLASTGLFLVTTVLSTRQYRGDHVALPDIIRAIFISMWVTLTTALFCACLLSYELVWKRRDSLAKSSLINNFARVALRTSLFATLMIVAGTCAITYAYVTGNQTGLLVTLVFAKLYMFSSTCSILYTLLHRAASRLGTAHTSSGSYRIDGTAIATRKSGAVSHSIPLSPISPTRYANPEFVRLPEQPYLPNRAGRYGGVQVSVEVGLEMEKDQEKGGII
ncbi:hypothetical protein JCM10213_002331 [Rhodosporidiobolus nylandii]